MADGAGAGPGSAEGAARRPLPGRRAGAKAAAVADGERNRRSICARQRGAGCGSALHRRGSARQTSGSFSAISACGRAKGRVGAPLSNPCPALRIAPPSPPASSSFLFLNLVWCALRLLYRTFSHKTLVEEKKSSSRGKRHPGPPREGTIPG